ncbi:hypothetical protein GLAREA_00788 [Glarea lozoyensis ATCC 20868]|uniref:Uncharacterized protein n=1 Tax=Glarea lozoyensis (strain ATCC 20868 / MF5171) TaxID=1116229 RepID=S3DT69_GLAL2|nr:uncharacterized protein GLAREA_00788 [Glarea lozoyensis ATCC 20868]EPE29628.1 hypothetical protein GLAREA_00788 [Glarea lozoyensis ATCC 20868]
MAHLEPGSGQSISPTSSGRASPITRKWTTEETPSKDKAYRRYASGVERSLSLFDTALQEWADYISFLGRLLKSLQAHPSTITTVPSRAIVAKRLAQCLNPSLPSGVHQKALEVYAYIFTLIGKDSLSRDLPLYFPGLASTLSFASLSVRTPFLDLLEKHMLKLDAGALRPALKAIILSVLPGLEEETSEEFERTLKLLDEFKHSVRSTRGDDLGHDHNSADEYFWQCFFLAAITSNTRRLGALAYLTRNLPKLGKAVALDSTKSAGDESSPEEDKDSSTSRLADLVTSPEPGLLLRCFAAGLADEQLLIQRGFLDLLVTHLPLQSHVLQNRVKAEDLELLITAAAGVVARRDMSLNRRLWTWLLGPEPVHVDGEDGSESPMSLAADPLTAQASLRTRYFEEYGIQPLTQALLRMITRESTNPVERARPFRICLSLMDRWEIGGLVVPEIFLPVVDSVRKYKDIASTKDDFSEVLRSASVFFDGVESGLIWGEIVGLIAQAIEPGSATVLERKDKLSLVKFILAHFNVREEEMLVIHAPLATLTILAMLKEAVERPGSHSDGASLSDDVTQMALNTAIDLFDFIPERAFQDRPSTTEPPIAKKTEETESLKHTAESLRIIQTFYVQDQGNLDAIPPPFSIRVVSGLLFREIAVITSQSISKSVSSADAGLKSKLLVTMLNKLPTSKNLDVEQILLSVESRLSTLDDLPFATFTSIVSLMTTLFSAQYISAEDLSKFVEPLVRIAWSYLSPAHPKYHVETVRCLWQLQSGLTLSNREIESTICSLMLERNIEGTFIVRDADAGRRFSILWTHTLQDNSVSTQRRTSKSNAADSRGVGRVLGAGYYEVMLSRPLFLLLDALLDEQTQLFMTAKMWLQGLTGLDKLFNLIIRKLGNFECLQRSSLTETNSTTVSSHIYTQEDDLDQCFYYLQTFSNILRWSSDSMWAALAQNTITAESGYLPLKGTIGHKTEVSFLEFFVQVCSHAMAGRNDRTDGFLNRRISQLHRTALTVLHQIMLSPYSSQLADLHLEDQLIDRLIRSLGEPDPLVQVLLLDVVYDSLKIRAISAALNPSTLPTTEIKRTSTQDVTQNQTTPSTVDRDQQPSSRVPPPPQLLIKALQEGLASPNSRPVLDSWVGFLTECLPLYSESIFQVLIPLVETLCAQVGGTFEDLQNTFKDSTVPAGTAAPESTLISLINALEQVLAWGHDRLLQDESKAPAVKSPELPQGFFGNMVSNVFTSEAPQSRSATANNRLTVLLTFQDAVRICFLIWSWGGRGASSQDLDSAASFNYTSLRMRNRARRLLEHLFAAEALECLETVVEVWLKSTKMEVGSSPAMVFNLLHVLDGSRPKHTIPAIFNAIYSRTNPLALDPARKSTMTSSLNDTDLVIFLVEYARSLDDDAMDEIWTDCMTFLRDLLTNPFPHRQTLPSLLEFAAILGEKVDNTNFGEQRKMRRDLGDLFLRLLTATFTTRPMGFSENTNDTDSAGSPVARSDDVVGILASIAPNLPKILVESDRVLSASSTISTSVIGPTFKSKAFPENVNKSTLVLLYQLSRLPNNQKAWKRDLGDAFNDPKFFQSQVSLVESDWLPLLKQWTLNDKERMPEILLRLVPPATAGIVFGVGATSARLEADRKTQLNLRRAATLVLATANDSFVTDLPLIQDKIVELLPATTTSSPSSTTRADIYMLLRALVLKTSAIHFATLWPIINAELHTAISSVVAADHSAVADTYNNTSVLQACKLLDTLICIAPDDFQLHEWLFITDTIDAVYRPAHIQPAALADELSEELSAANINSEGMHHQASSSLTRKPLIGPGGINDEGNWERRDDLVAKVLRPFFGQLSIYAFESTYTMAPTDWSACRSGLLEDLFDERTIVKAL